MHALDRFSAPPFGGAARSGGGPIDLGRPVGTAHPPFIIASFDARELGSLERAERALDVAADSHCDAVKLARLPWAWSARLFSRAEHRNLVMLVPAFDEQAVTRLDWLGAPGFYLFYDWTDLELVARAASTGKPLVMQVGTASEAELAEVIETADSNGTGGIALVQSVIDAELDGLAAISRQASVVGIADRSPGTAIPLAAISRGASIVEKRFKIGDEGASLRAAELAGVVRDCELAWAAQAADRRWSVN
jgi:pseudaminic acid synthase